jgi:hypothetical protein
MIPRPIRCFVERLLLLLDVGDVLLEIRHSFQDLTLQSEIFRMRRKAGQVCQKCLHTVIDFCEALPATMQKASSYNQQK